MKTREEAISFGLSFPDTKRMIAESYDLITDTPTKRIYEAVKRIRMQRENRQESMFSEEHGSRRRSSGQKV